MRMLALLLGSLFLTGLLSQNVAHAQVWEDTNSWSPAWEAEFAKWVEQNWTVDFFARKSLPTGEPNPYYGLRADCADTVYSMRIVFSAEHGLPFAMQDPTTYNRIITNRMTRFNSVANPGTRVRSFLRYIYDMVSTQAMPNDTFPVPVSREFIHAGAMLRTTKVNHHSWSVKLITATGVPFLVFNSTVTAASRLTLQQRTSWPNPYWFFEGDFTPASNAGFRYWRPLDTLLQPAWKVPNYSEEQFRIPLASWEKTVQQKLALRKEGDEEKMVRLFQTACESGKTRVDSVNDGIKILRALTGQCMDEATYDIVSTPSRDHRLFDDLVALRRAYKEVVRGGRDTQLSPKIQSELNHLFPAIRASARTEVQQMTATSGANGSTCVINYAQGRSMDLAELKRRLFMGLISNNPMDEMVYRWGEAAGPSPQAQACESWGVWRPDLRQAD